MRINSAAAILDERIKDRPDLQEAVRRQLLNIQWAQLIYDMRKAAQISQKDLAKLVGTSQSAIARLENADYSGRTYQMLERIALALGYELTIEARKSTKTDRSISASQRNHVEVDASADVESNDLAANNNYAFAA